MSKGHRKPTAALKLHGGYRKHRHADRVEASNGRPVKPDYLKDHGAELWDQLIDQLTAWGAAECDTAALASMCEWWDRYRKCMDLMTDPSAESGYKLQVLAGQAWNNFYRMAGQFGITPADRAKLKMPKNDKDDLDEFLNGTA